jgi:hypothetical protein
VELPDELEYADEVTLEEKAKPFEKSFKTINCLNK